MGILSLSRKNCIYIETKNSFYFIESLTELKLRLMNQPSYIFKGQSMNKNIQNKALTIIPNLLYFFFRWLI